jgi:hypothetical protein
MRKPAALLLVCAAAIVASLSAFMRSAESRRPLLPAGMSGQSLERQQVTRTPAPAIGPTATFFAQLSAEQTAVVGTATADAREAQSLATFTPAPATPVLYPARYRPAWLGKMVKLANGAWMAPQEIVDQATRNYDEYYAWFRSKDRAFVALPDGAQRKVYARYMSGEVLRKKMAGLAASDVDYTLVSSTRFEARVIRVIGFSADGMQMTCDLAVRDLEIEVVEAATGKPRFMSNEPDRVYTDVLTYDPKDRRWKWSETKSSVVLVN